MELSNEQKTNIMKRYTMNRITQLIITLSVSFCAMSCIEEVGTELPDTSDYITVTSEVDMQTKAGYEGTSVLPSSFTMTIKQGTGSANPYTMNRAGTSSNHYNFSGNAPTWTTPDVSQVSIKAITASEADVADGILDFAVQFDQSSDSAVQNSDLLGAKTGAGITISGNNINVAFNHLMSKLQVSYTSELEIDHIELANVAVEGKYNYTDMKHVYPVTSTGDIIMFSNTSSAEAIFFPFDPKESEVTPELRIHLKNKTILTRQLKLKEGSRFLPGKLYIVNISVSGNSEVKIENWGANASVKIPGERVLWIGTSIPSGHPGLYTSYPELVDEALNCTVVNNARPGSFVIPQKSASWAYVEDANNPGTYVPWWDPNDSNYPLIAGGLAQTHRDIETIYRPHFNLLTNDSELIERELNEIKAYSYESLIIPYIDGTIDNCTTVIIDHGYNDRTAMIYEAIGLASFPVSVEHVHGYNYLMKLKNKEIQYSTPAEGDWEVDYLDLLAIVPNLCTLGNYIVEMNKIISAIKVANPNVRIIIGNYFSLNNPEVTSENAQFASVYSDYMYFANLISYYNEAVAGMWDLDIVNVQNYIWLDDQSFYEFCPDKTHPWGNPDSIRRIADIYIKALDGVIGSRVN